MALAARRFFSVEELGEAINAEGSHLAQATLYATLELLCEAGLLGRKHYLFLHRPTGALTEDRLSLYLYVFL